MKKIKLILASIILMITASSCDDKEILLPNAASIKIGDIYLGGTVFYVDGAGGGLIAYPTDLADKAWSSNSITVVSTSTALGTGKANTSSIYNSDNYSGYAADACMNISSDWYLPSKMELRKLLDNRTTAHLTGILTGTNDYYWTSSEYKYNPDQNGVTVPLGSAAYTDKVTSSTYGYYSDKSILHHVRAIRSF